LLIGRKRSLIDCQIINTTPVAALIAGARGEPKADHLAFGLSGLPLKAALIKRHEFALTAGRLKSSTVSLKIRL